MHLNLYSLKNESMNYITGMLQYEELFSMQNVLIIT